MTRFLTSIQTQLNNADSVLDATRVQSDPMIDGLMRRFAAAEIPIERDTVTEVMTAFGALLQSKRDVLHRAESGVVDEAADDKEPMDARNAAVESLRENLTQMRTFIENHGASSDLSTYGVRLVPPPRTADLATYAREAIRLLKANPRDFDVFGNPISTTTLAARLEAPLAQVDGASGAVSQERRELDLARDERNVNRADFEEVYSGVVSIFASVLDLAGRPGLAERLRPTARRVRGDEEVILDGDADSPEPNRPEPVVEG